MSNFINQFKKEHDLIDELVTNAFESCENRIKIVHFGKSILFINDGKSMSIHDIKKNLLTAFETGEEKSLETNRGLGFIAIYGYMIKTIVKTGKYIVIINSWEDINISKNSQIISGTEIEVFLNKESQKKYSFNNVQEHLSRWYYHSDHLMLFGKNGNLKQIGTKLSRFLELKSHKNYKYENLKYNLFPMIDSDAKVNFLLKLTNIGAYRLLPINFVAEDKIKNYIIDEITLVISHGSYLDTTRRNLSNFGTEQVIKLLTLVNQKFITKSIRKEYFHISGSAKKILKERLNSMVNQKYLDTDVSNKGYKNICSHFNNLSSILIELDYFDKIMELISGTKITVILGTLYPQLEFNKEYVDAKTFREWFNKRFEEKIDDIFSNLNIGFIYNSGKLEGEAKLLHVKKYNWIIFNNKLLNSKLIIEEHIILAFNGIIQYLTDDVNKITIEDLMTKNLRKLVSKDRNNEIMIENNNNNKYIKEFGIDLTRLNIEEITLESKETVLCLVHSDGKDLYEKLQFNENIIQGYNIWKKLISIIIEFYTQDITIIQNIKAVLLFKGDNSTKACKFANLLGISIDQLPSDNNIVSNCLKLLYPAIHEVSHIFVPNHSWEFFNTEAIIMNKLQNNSEIVNKIQNLFELNI